jgi:hypothetical protein
MHNLLQMLTLLDLSELHQVPHSPGIYVWYVKPVIGKPDWAENLDGLGIDRGDSSLRSVLYEFTKTLSPPDISANLTTAFRDSWSGRLGSVGYEENAKKIVTPGLDSDFSFPANKFDQTLASERLRRALAERLEQSLATFWTPIYIGKSSDLNSRLSQHIKAFRRLYDLDPPKHVLESYKLNDEKLSDAQPNLAARLYYSGIRPDQSRIGYLSTKIEGLTKPEQTDLAEVLEWLLNTWNRPTLGKN